jgi:hyaluronate lyase
MQRDRTFGASYFGTPGERALSLYDMRLLQAVERSPDIVAAPETPGVRLYPSMDRAIMRGNGYGLAFSLFSPRISAFEYGNRENASGWWTGVGMLSLYNADQRQFGGNFWATVDAQRLPGTTTDHSAAGKPSEWHHYPNSESWSGGASLRGRYGVLGMAFSMQGVTGSDLAGRKSWFLFGDKVLALGSGITASRATETIVENRKLEGAGQSVLLAGDRAAATTPGKPEMIDGAAWAHLGAELATASVGYCFPERPAITVLREERSGRWSDIQEAQSKAEVRDRYLSIALPHGSAPANARYSYLLLPGASAVATKAYCARPSIVAETNTESAAAASDSALHLYAAALWRGGQTAELDGKPLLRSDAPAAVVLHEEEGRLELSISDPTQGARRVTLEVMRPMVAALTLDPAIEVLQTQPTLRLRVNVEGAAGRSLEGAFRLAPGAALFASKSAE